MSTQPPGAPGPENAHRSPYGDAGANPADSMIPPRALPEDMSQGWVPEDARQRPRGPLPGPSLFSFQTLLPRTLREGIRHPWEVAWVIVGLCISLAGYIFAFSVFIANFFFEKLRVATPTTLDEYVLYQLQQTAAQIVAIAILAPLVIFFVRGLMYAQMRLSAVRMSPTQFPEGYRMVVEAARAAGLRRVPDAYVQLGNGQINAFSAGHGFRRFVVIYSDLFEIGGKARDPEALRFIIGHEVGHIAAGHTSYFRLLGLAVFNYVPLLNLALSRAQEYTADNFGYRFTPSGAYGSIRVLAAGKYLNADVNVEEFADRAVTERGPFTWMANLGMTHPALTWRAHALRDRSAPGRLLWRPKSNPVGSPMSLVPSAEKAALWPDPVQAEGFLEAYPEKPGNQHWGVNETKPWIPVGERDRKIADLLDIRWMGPGLPRFGGPASPMPGAPGPVDGQGPVGGSGPTGGPGGSEGRGGTGYGPANGGPASGPQPWDRPQE